MTIHYIAHNDAVLKPLREQYFAAQGIDLHDYTQRDTDTDVNTLLLIEPIQINKDYYAISSAWKPWLMEHHPHLRLIVGGFGKSLHPNALNLLDLPLDFKAWLSEKQPVSAFRFVEVASEETEAEGPKKQLIDLWNLDLPLRGKALNQDLRKFFEGHEMDRDYFFKEIGKMKSLLHKVASNQSDTSQIWGELSHLRERFVFRWKYYDHLFDWVPYQDAVKKVREIMKNLAAAEPSGEQNAQKMLSLLDQLLQIAKDEMFRHIFAEAYW